MGQEARCCSLIEYDRIGIEEHLRFLFLDLELHKNVDYYLSELFYLLKD